MKVIVAGGGKMGIALVSALLGGENEVTVIDTNDSVIQKISDRYDVQTMVANAMERATLQACDVKNYDLIVAATESDEVNMVICRFAKLLGCPAAVARIREPENTEQMDFIKESMNIDFTVNPDMACAQAAFRQLTERYSLKGGRLVSGKTAILECEIENLPHLIDKEIKELSPILNGVLVAAISRNGKILVPNGSTKLLKGDILYVIGLEKRINEIEIKSRRRKSSTGVNKVMIAGGGDTGFYLAKMLEQVGINVKLIEKNPERCVYLSEQLVNTLVLNGDATDNNLLREEGLDAVDAFVSCTGFDEENLLLSLIAKKNGVDDVITKMSHGNYEPLVDSLGVDMIINPMELSAASVLRFAEREGIVIFSEVIQGQAEFIEISAESGMPLVGRKLMDLDIPEGVLIASVNRKDQVIIPKGSTVIEPGDKVTILALLSSIAGLESMLKR